MLGAGIKGLPLVVRVGDVACVGSRCVQTGRSRILGLQHLIWQ